MCVSDKSDRRGWGVGGGHFLKISCLSVLYLNYRNNSQHLIYSDLMRIHKLRGVKTLGSINQKNSEARTIPLPFQDSKNVPVAF